MSQNFKSIFVDEGMANELSALALKMSCPKISRFVYSREELIDICEEPSFVEYRAQYVAKLKEQAHKYPWIEEIERGRENKIYELLNNRRTIQSKEPPRINERYRNPAQKNSPLNWRTGGNNGCSNSSNITPGSGQAHTGYERSRHGHNSHNQNKNNRNNRNNTNSGNRNNDRYSRNCFDDDEEEEEPEWMTAGPDTMMDFIELKGFDDDPLTYQALSNDNASVGTSSNSDRRESSINDHSDFAPIDLHGEADIFSPSAPSFFADSGSNTGSSRANRWFKKPIDSSTSTSAAPAASGNENSRSVGQQPSPTIPSVQSLMDRIRAASGSMNGATGNGIPPPPNQINIDFSKATSLADVEANMLPNKLSALPVNLPDGFSKMLNISTQAEQQSTLPSMANLPKSASASPQLTPNQPFAQQIGVKPQPIPQQPPSSQMPLSSMQANAMAMMMNQFYSSALSPAFRGMSPAQYAQMIGASMPFMNPELARQQMMLLQMNQFGQNMRHMMHLQQSQSPQNPPNNLMNAAVSPMALPVNLSPKPAEITKAEKLLKNSTITPTSVFRKTLKSGDQAKPVNVEKSDPVNTMIQQMNALKVNNNNNINNNNNNNPKQSIINSPVAIHSKNDLAARSSLQPSSKPNAMSLLSSLNGANGPKLPMPMPAQAFTLDDIEKM